jgi:hypothetical protein
VSGSRDVGAWDSAAACVDFRMLRMAAAHSWRPARLDAVVVVQR